MDFYIIPCMIINKKKNSIGQKPYECQQIQTAFRAAVETHLRSKELKRHIDSKLMSGTQAKEKLVEKELLISDITRLQNRLKIAEQARNDLRNDLESFQFANRSAKIKLSEEYESLVRNRLKLEKKKDQYFDQREELVKIGTLLGQKRRKLITDLAFIYPIYESPHTRDYYVCNINLPNSDILFEKDENAVSAALGYTAHLISMIYYFLDVPLRYPIRFKCSRSEIIDNFQTVIPDKIFPLYARGKEKVVFEYAVWILNKNVAQLRQYCGLSTKDFRPTLANIMGLLNSRLSIHVDHSNLLSNFIIPSMTHLIPPNFGGPQPSKSKILINRITDDTAEEKASSSSCSSEDDEEDEIIENNGNVVLINNELSIDPITEEESLNSVQKKLDETGEDALLFDLEVENRTCRSNSEDGDCIRTSSNC
ncbi:DgyrCDS3514 [Dimorphilus gyrociliatus]|uniref:DgyrCDS3514 n=1 Tax=Dimorphilus gyrociliatus TaxID=2664684 RepID=A0A7I8VFI1_9ANNE|nr:DgyrCDS3514 [Dimorphilus gyrociliatus]